MNIDTFSTQLIQSLTARGIDGQTAGTYVETLIRTLTEEDLREISGYRTKEDFTALSESLSELIREKTAPPQSPTNADMHTKPIRTEPVQPTDVETRIPLDTQGMQHTKIGMRPVHTSGTTAVRQNPADMEHTRIGDPVPGRKEQEHPLWGEEINHRGFIPLTPKGKTFFWGILFLTLPLSVSFAALLLFIFSLCFLTVCALIAASFLLIGGEVVAGTASFLIGTIYGAIQICTVSTGIGIYEIGLGIICAGVSLSLGVLTYHLAVRALPYVLQQELLFARHFLRQIKPMLNRWREECNKR